MDNPSLENQCSVLRFFPTLLVCAMTASMTTSIPYEGVELVSKQQFRSGKFQAKIKVASGGGLINAMFLFYEEGHQRGIYWREIDWEVLGINTLKATMDIHYGTGNYNPNSEFDLRYIMHIDRDVPYHLHEDYYWYTIEWTQKRITRYIHTKNWDKTVAYHSIRTKDIQADGGPPVDVNIWNKVPMTLRFNFWAYTNPGWSGVVDQSKIGNAKMLIDEVIYSRLVSEDHDGHGTFVKEWHDTMDGFDSTRWSNHASHTIMETRLNRNHLSFNGGNAVLSIHWAS